MFERAASYWGDLVLNRSRPPRRCHHPQSLSCRSEPPTASKKPIAPASNATRSVSSSRRRHYAVAIQDRDDQFGPGVFWIGEIARNPSYPAVVFKAATMSSIAVCSGSLTSWPCSRWAAATLWVKLTMN